MARKGSLDIATLSALGAERLARLVLERAENDPAFRKLVKAALAATDGPEAVAKLVDRRLAALEKARSYIDWRKERAFVADLAATLHTMTGDLAALAPAMAIERLVRFLATQDLVHERVDDSAGRVDAVYGEVVEALGRLVPQLRPDEADALPEAMTARLRASDNGYLLAMAQVVIPHLPRAALARWGKVLADDASAAGESGTRSFRTTCIRQAIAEAQGDLDAYIELEESKHPNVRDRVSIAERLLAVNRAEEALTWIREPRASGGLRMMSIEDLADGAGPRDPSEGRRVLIEARILEALGRGKEAQALRWSAFAERLDAEALGAYLDALPDFEEFDAIDRAVAIAHGSRHRYHALVFFLEWPRLADAARLVETHADDWDGRSYEILAPAADLLEDAHPLAATILLRALTTSILDRAASRAYPHAAADLDRLDRLAARIEAAPLPKNMPPHASWRDALERTHARKHAFWSLLPTNKA